MLPHAPEPAVLNDDITGQNLMNIIEVLGMINDVLEAKQKGIYFVLIPSQQNSNTVSWEEE